MNAVARRPAACWVPTAAGQQSETALKMYRVATAQCRVLEPAFRLIGFGRFSLSVRCCALAAGSPFALWVRPRTAGSAHAMKILRLLSSVLIGAVASARSMTPMAALAAARLAGRRTPGPLILLDRPMVRYGALAMGVGELLGDKMKTAPDRTVALGLLARTMSAGIAGAALAPRGRGQAGAAIAVATAVPLAFVTLAGRKRAMARIGQTRSGLIEDALMVAAGMAVVAMATRSQRI